eukprot:2235271-Lingulodinium_polyedra.AAC.1
MHTERVRNGRKQQQPQVAVYFCSGHLREPAGRNGRAGNEAENARAFLPRFPGGARGRNASLPVSA